MRDAQPEDPTMANTAEAAALSGSFLAKLKASSSAEEIFEMLDVGYEAEVLNVARLHILKRMSQYLAEEDIDGMPDTVAAVRCKAALERAYQDFVTSSPLRHRVFKVLKDAAAPPRPATFVPFDTLLK
jgi:nitrogenase-stabilizing/protective protein